MDGQGKTSAQAIEEWQKQTYEYSELLQALEDSLKLQSYYAKLLKDSGGPTRLEFRTVDSWIQHLRNMTE